MANKERGNPKPDKNRFSYAISAAVEAERRFREQERHICTGLTAKQFLREAELQAGIDTKAQADTKLEALSAALDMPGHDAANAALRRMIRSITGQETFRFDRPSKRIGHLIDQEGLAELASCNASALDLFALAARRAANERPSAFGEVQDMPTAEQKLESLRAELNAAVDAVETSWAADDLQVAEDGRCTFRRFPSVTLTSIDLGPRLRDAALKEAAKQRAA